MLTEIAIEKEGALQALSAFEPTTWTLIRFRLWNTLPSFFNDSEIQLYNVLHVSVSKCGDNHA